MRETVGWTLVGDDIHRALVDVATEACAVTIRCGSYGLASASGAWLGSVGPAGVVDAALQSGGLCTTASELTDRGGALEALVLAELSSDSVPTKLWVLDGWSLLRAHGSAVDLRGASLRGAQLRGARLRGADLTDADLSGADMEKADLSDANLTGATLAGTILFSSSLQRADLTEADLSRADLRHADMRDSVCVRTALRGADLWGAYMWNVDVTQAFTVGTDLSRADYLNEKVS